MEKNIKLIDLWYLDGNYNQPIKSQGFKSLVKTDIYYVEKEGYVFIEPKTNAFMVTKDNETVFEKLEDANYHLKNEIKKYIEYKKRYINEYTEDLKKLTDLLNNL